jgi:SAM-dependent methyltransferase
MKTSHIGTWVSLIALSVAAACAEQKQPATAQGQAVPPPSPPAQPQPAPAEASTQSATVAGADVDAKAAPATSPAPAEEPTTRTPDVVYVPTPQPVVDKMLDIAKVKKTDIVYDLGCGDGRIVVTAAKKYGAKSFGFDIDPQRVAEAKENVKKNGVEHLVTIEQKDIFTLDLTPASVVTLYLLPRLNVKLIPQLEKMKPGSRIVSHDFAMEGMKPVQHLTLKPAGESEEHQIYFWRIPFEKETGKTSSL